MDAKERPAPSPHCPSAGAEEVLFTVEGSSDEGGYTAQAVGHSVFAEGGTLESLQESVRSAVACHFGDKVADRASIRLVIDGAQVVLKSREPS